MSNRYLQKELWSKEFDSESELIAFVGFKGDSWIGFTEGLTAEDEDERDDFILVDCNRGNWLSVELA